MIVYFITGDEDNHPIKIGRSECLTRLRTRLKNIQNMSPVKIKCLGIINGPLHLESELHDKFKDIRLWGEWFKKTDELLAYIKEESTLYKFEIEKKQHRKTAMPSPARVNFDKEFLKEFYLSFKKEHQGLSFDIVSEINSCLNRIHEFSWVSSQHDFHHARHEIHKSLRRVVDKTFSCDWRESEYILENGKITEATDDLCQRLLNDSLETVEKRFLFKRNWDKGEGLCLT